MPQDFHLEPTARVARGVQDSFGAHVVRAGGGYDVEVGGSMGLDNKHARVGTVGGSWRGALGANMWLQHAGPAAREVEGRGGGGEGERELVHEPARRCCR